LRFAFGDGVDLERRVYHRADDKARWEIVFDESKGDPRVTPLAFDRDNRIAWMACPGRSGVGGLCKWDVASRELRTVWSGTEAGMLEVVRSFDGRDVVALRSMPGRTATTLIDRDAP